MKNKIVAKRYAEGFLEFAKETLGLDKGIEELRFVERVINDHPGIKTVIENSRIPEAQKYGIIERGFGAAISKETKHFLNLIIQKKRFKEILNITAASETLFCRAQGVEKAVITTAFELDAGTLGIIKNRLETKYGKTLKLDVRIDRGLIGGVKTQIGNLVLDGSVKKKLEQLKEHLMETGVN